MYKIIYSDKVFQIKSVGAFKLFIELQTLQYNKKIIFNSYHRKKFSEKSGISNSSISKYLKVLKNLGIIEGKNGLFTFVNVFDIIEPNRPLYYHVHDNTSVLYTKISGNAVKLMDTFIKSIEGYKNLHFTLDVKIKLMKEFKLSETELENAIQELVEEGAIIIENNLLTINPYYYEVET